MVIKDMFAYVAYIRMQERLFVLVTPSKLLAPSAITTLPMTVHVEFKVSKCVVFISFQRSISLDRTNRLTSHISPRVHVFIDFKVSFTQCLVTSSSCLVCCCVCSAFCEANQQQLDNFFSLLFHQLVFFDDLCTTSPHNSVQSDRFNLFTTSVRTACIPQQTKVRKSTE